MFSLRLLGAADLRDASGDTVGGLLAQTSRFAVLAYLCVRGGTMVRRDELLPIFWPELDEKGARNALSQALHVIRRQTSAKVIVSRGGEVGIGENVLQCDVIELERLSRSGDNEGAIALYGGDLLPAFNLSGVPAFERWLDAERSRLRATAALCARRASDEAAARGDLAGAVKYARVLVDIDQDERALRALMTLLEASGDRAAALAAHQEFAKRVRDSLELELSAETRALVARLGDRDERRVDPEPQAEFVPSSAAVQERAPITTSVAAARAPRRRLAAAVATVTTLAVLGVAWIMLRTPSARAAAPTVRVAVMPFRIFATPDLAYLSGGMMDVLSIDMDGIGPVRMIDPHAVTSFVAHADTSDGVALGAAAARALSADRFVLGTVVVSGTQAKVSATLYNAAGQVMITGTVDVQGTSNVLNATDRIARQLLAHELPNPAQGLSRLAALTSTSTTALRHYLDGERLYRDGQFDLAAESFGAAVRLDSTFALGNYRLAASLDWGIHRWGGESQYDYLARALRHMERLGARDQQVIRALYEFWRGSPEKSAQLYRGVVADRPDDVEAWEGLAEVTFHRLVHFGSPIESARAPFERVLRLDPENVNAMVHLARLAALRRDNGAVTTLGEHALELAPSHDATYELKVLVGLASPRANVRAHALDVIRSAPEGDERRQDPSWLAGWRVATFREDPAAGLSVARMLAEPARPASSRLLGNILAAEMLAGMGRWDDASRQLDAASRIDSPIASQIRANLTFLGPFAATPARIAQLRTSLGGTAALRPVPSALRSTPLAPSFVRGLVALALHDTTELRRAEQELDTLSADSAHAEGYRFQSTILRARALAQAGAVQQALTILETKWPVIGLTSVPHYARASERLLRADLLHAAGRNAEAIRWYASVPEDLGMGIMFAAPAHLGAARAYEAMGNAEGARREYGNAADFWANADADLKAIASDARRRAGRSS